jgi:hypothetical protein
VFRVAKLMGLEGRGMRDPWASTETIATVSSEKISSVAMALVMRKKQAR